MVLFCCICMFLSKSKGAFVLQLEMLVYFPFTKPRYFGSLFVTAELHI